MGARLYYVTYLFAAPSTYKKQAVITMPDGRRFQFIQNDDGTFTPPTGRRDVLIQNGDGTFDLTFQWSRSSLHFDVNGSWLSTTDDYGNTLNVTYDSGRVYQIADGSGSGRYLTIGWGPDGRISTIQDSAGRLVQYDYYPQGTLRTVTDAANHITTYSYQPGRFSPLLSQIRDHWNRVVSDVVFDSKDRVRTYTEEGETYTYDYRPNNVTWKTDSAGNRTIYSYTAGGFISDTTAPPGGGGTQSLVVGADGIIQQIVDPVGVKTKYDYDVMGRIQSVTRDYQGTQAIRFDYGYDPIFPHRITSITPKNPATGLVNPDWQAWQHEYWQAGNPAPGALRYVKRVKSDGATLETLATYDYNTKGQVTRYASATGAVTDYGYDPQNNLTSITGPANNDAGTRPITVYVPDGLGRIQSVTDPLAHTTNYAYDNLNRVLTVTLPKPSPGSPLDFTTTYNYDNYDAPSGLLFTHATDPNGKLTKQGYDQFGRFVKSIDAQNHETLYTYTRDKLTSIKDANNYVTSYGYDPGRRLQTTAFPDSMTEQYSYWDDGLLKTKTDRKSQTITYNYDRHKRLQSKSYPGNSITYTYTGQKLTQVNDTTVLPNETHTFGYDTSYRVQTNTQATRGSIGYTYNADDTVATYAVSGGPTATYGYYPNGSLNTIDWTPVSGQFKYTYRLTGQYDTITLPNGQHRDLSYDDQGRLLQIANIHPGTGNLATYAYGYDHDWTTDTDAMLGQRTSLTATVPSQGFSGSLTKYYYDPLYQLTRVDYPNVAPFNGEIHQWTYDNIGNRLTNTVNSSTQTYTYQKIGANPLNWQRLLNDGDNAYTYDPNGSGITRNGSPGSFTFGWDRENRMANISGSTAATYKSDYQGRRSTKTVGAGTTYLYDGLNLIREAGASSADYLFGPGIDEPIAMNRGGTISYYSSDGLGSVATLNDPAGTVQNNYVYDAWGVTRSQTEAVSNPFTYTAREKGEAGTLFYRARYLSPTIGRFLSEDRIDPQEGLSVYDYVLSTPLALTDPEGLCPWQVRDRPTPPFRDNQNTNHWYFYNADTSQTVGLGPIGGGTVSLFLPVPGRWESHENPNDAHDHLLIPVPDTNCDCVTRRLNEPGPPPNYCALGFPIPPPIGGPRRDLPPCTNCHGFVKSVLRDCGIPPPAGGI